MYQEFYGLDADPFRLSPDHGYCLRHPTFQKAKAYMQFAAHRAEGFVMITGRPGTGKTTLIEDVLAEIEGQEVLAAKLVSAQLHAEDLLRMTAFNFGIGAANKSKSDLLMEMQGFFADRLADGQRPLLVIDEAQGLSLNALEELRLLTNLRINGQPMLQIFLVGQEELRDLVLDPKMEQLHQRMIAACHLEPLDFKQAAAYVMHRLKVSGWNGQPRLDAQIFPSLYRFSHGIPRRINLFMGRLLLHGWLEEKTELGGPEAETVLAELKSEHLAPTKTNNFFDDSLGLNSEQEIDPALLMPDQKIGAQLMRKSAQPAMPKAAPVNPRPAAAPPPPPPEPPPEPPASVQSPPTAVVRPAPKPSSQANEKAGTAPPDAGAINQVTRSARGAGRFLGLTLALSVLLTLALGVLLVSPMPSVPNGPFHSLLHESGLHGLRVRLYRLSGGSLPLFSPGLREGGGRASTR
jgi:general secretion pathway protein A